MCYDPILADFTEYDSLVRYPNLYEVRLIPTKKDIAFVEYMDEGSATVAKEALHNHKLDGESKLKVKNHLALRFNNYSSRFRF